MIWAKTNRDIARVLNIKLFKQRNRLRDQLSEINGWRKRDDFPKFHKGKGYSGKELLDWAERFAAIIAPEKQRRAAVAQILSDDVPAKQSLKILQKSEVRSQKSEWEDGETDGAARPSLPNNEEAETFRPVESIRQLAPRLSKHFKCHITEQRIKDWLNGELPAGVSEPFPLRDLGSGLGSSRNGWNNPRPCFEWVQKYWVKPGGGAMSQDDLFAKTAEEARMAEMRHTIDDARKAKAEADAKERENSERWILRADALGTATRAINDILHLIDTEYERNAPGRRRERLAALLAAKMEDGRWKMASGESLSSILNLLFSELEGEFYAWDLEEERGRIDRIRAACAARAAWPGEAQMQNEKC